MNSNVTYPRYEMVYVTFEDGDHTFLHKISLDEFDGVEYTDSVMSFDHPTVVEMFSEKFRWTMLKMTCDEYYDDYCLNLAR